jgi:tripartite-type tricarboxylate transporter receptor subunit TctC
MTGVARRSLAAAGIGLLPWRAGAQAYPGRQPVSLIIPYPPGGIPDVFGQAITQGLTQRLGGSFVMDHRPGGSTTIGVRAAARARPDGSTLLLASIGMLAIVPLTMRNPGFDPVADLVPLGMTGSALYVYVAHPRWASIPALVDAARQRPGTITLASWGIGSAAHLAMVDLEQRAGIELVHVPYAGTAQALTDVSTGRVDAMVATLAPAKPHLEAGRVRALAVTMPERFRLLPEVPTMAELGFPDNAASNWTGCAAPAGTPPAIAAVLETALAATFSDPALLARLEPLGITPTPTGAAVMRDQLARDIAQSRALIRRAGIVPE